jgi:hypothetical protein
MAIGDLLELLKRTGHGDLQGSKAQPPYCNCYGCAGEVPTCHLGVFDQAVAAGFQHLGDVPLGDGLLDAAGQQGGGVLAAAGLVGGQQQHPGALQFVFDAGAVVGEPRDPVDGFADDGVKAPVGAGGFGKQVVEATVAAQGDVELLVGAAEPAFVEVFAAGFDVVEVADNGGAGG